MKYIKKGIRAMFHLLALVVLLIGCACAYTGPAYVSEQDQAVYREILKHDVPAFKGLTVSGVLKAADKEMDFRKDAYMLTYTYAKNYNGAKIIMADTIADNLKNLSHLAGPIVAAAAYSTGLKKKRSGDLSAEEATALKYEWGTKDPAQAQQELS